MLKVEVIINRYHSVDKLVSVDLMVRKEVANSVLNGRKPTPLLISKIETKSKLRQQQRKQLNGMQREEREQYQHNTRRISCLKASRLAKAQPREEREETTRTIVRNWAIRIISSLEIVI